MTGIKVKAVKLLTVVAMLSISSIAVAAKPKMVTDGLGMQCPVSHLTVVSEISDGIKSLSGDPGFEVSVTYKKTFAGAVQLSNEQFTALKVKKGDKKFCIESIPDDN